MTGILAGLTAKRREVFKHSRHSHGTDSRGQGERSLAGMQHVEPLQSEVLQRDPHRWRHVRYRCPLYLESEPRPALHDQQVKFSTCMCGPEITLFWPDREHQSLWGSTVTFRERALTASVGRCRAALVMRNGQFVANATDQQTGRWFA
jgi:hypothetical protein